jgi:ech hydrogenase subunit A
MAENAPLVAILLAFGSAPTLFFWSQWLGALLVIRPRPEPGLPPSPRPQRVAMFALALLTVAAALSFPLISAWVVEPHLALLFPGSPALDLWPLAVVIVLAVAMLGLPLYFSTHPSGALRQAPYMAGAGADDGAGFVNALHQPQALRLQNYRLESVIPAEALGRWALWVGAGLVLAAALAGVLA